MTSSFEQEVKGIGGAIDGGGIIIPVTSIEKYIDISNRHNVPFKYYEFLLMSENGTQPYMKYSRDESGFSDMRAFLDSAIRMSTIASEEFKDRIAECFFEVGS